MRKIVFRLAAISALALAPAAACAVELANPAAVYCLNEGGKRIIMQTPAGTRADCLLPNGKRIDEWKLYRRDHRWRR